MRALKSLTRVALVVAMICLLPLRGEVTVAQGVSTDAALDELCTGLNVVMARGERTGDYMLAKAAVKARHSIDVWRATNQELLDRPFSDLDPALRETFVRARTLIGEASDASRYRPELALELAEQASRIVDTRPGPPREVHVLSYSPRIVPPQNTTFTLRVRGLNLDKADPTLHLPGGAAERSLNGRHEAQFTVPVDVLPNHPTQLRVHTLYVTYTVPLKGFMARMFGRTEYVTRKLSIVRLPASVATFELSGTRTTDQRSEKAFTAEPVQFRGMREEQTKVISPPPPSRDGKIVWRWDLSKDLRVVQSRGMQGRCEGVDLSKSSETGVIVMARVEGDDKSRKKTKAAPGWVDCTLMGTVYRVDRAMIQMDKRTVTLGWMKEESLEVPADAREVELTATTFDGRHVRFAESEGDKFFDVRREGQRLIIVPKVPEDILAGD